MPYPFIRADEQRTRTPGPTPGVRIRFGNGVVHWFPGSTPELAMILARCAVPESLLNDPATTIEFGTGTGRGNMFIREQVIKEPPQIKR